MTQRIRGKFDVTMTPQTADAGGEPSIGRLALDKQYHGDLAATSQGQMLSTLTQTEGSAGYVALERVSGTLQGRSGSFALIHIGLMNRGDQSLRITVVPDSGTDGLAGLAGILAAPVYQVSPLMGSNLIIVVFAVVVVGGMGSILGAIVTGYVLGLVEGLTKVFYPEASSIVIFVIMAIVLLLRPAGLFGKDA